ncbi:hypothetical protein ES705_27996 [subsurface metagenome]
MDENENKYWQILETDVKQINETDHLDAWNTSAYYFYLNNIISNGTGGYKRVPY